MDNVKLPDLDRINDVEKRIKELPPQESVDDTSNWENRNVAAPVVDIENKKRTVRQLDFMRSETIALQAMTLDQIQRAKESSSKKPSE